MKKTIVFLIFMSIVLIHSATAQDQIIFRNGNIIDARVLEISPTEIKYRRIDNLDGPVIVISVSDVLTIRYENGTTHIFSDSQTAQERTPGLDPDKFIFGISANGGGAIVMALETGGGPGLRLEFGKGKFNAEINFSGGLDSASYLATFNYFWHSSIGGFYLGGGLGIVTLFTTHERNFGTFFQIGLNAGYKFVLKSGIYFRTGAFIGGTGGFGNLFFAFNPDISFGWTRK